MIIVEEGKPAQVKTEWQIYFENNIQLIFEKKFYAIHPYSKLSYHFDKKFCFIKGSMFYHGEILNCQMTVDVDAIFKNVAEFNVTVEDQVNHFVKMFSDQFIAFIKKNFEPADLKVTQCEGEGQGSCLRCEKVKGKWNRTWMAFLYHIEGYPGCYCKDCVEEIKNEVLGI